MNHLRVAGEKLRTFYPSVLIEVQWDDKMAVDIPALGRYGEGLHHRGNLVWLAYLPVPMEFRKRRCL